MNARKAKQLRRSAEHALYTWYLTLLEEDQQEDLTRELALQYTPYVDYWNEMHERTDRNGKEYVSYTRHVSQHTYRWFVLQEKKKHDNGSFSRW